jgi:hypothetical protein
MRDPIFRRADVAEVFAVDLGDRREVPAPATDPNQRYAR